MFGVHSSLNIASDHKKKKKRRNLDFVEFKYSAMCPSFYFLRQNDRYPNTDSAVH